MFKNNPFNRRLLFVTGKGGVGKSTVAIVLAKHFLSQGKKVLLVSLQPQLGMQRIYGLSHPIGYEPVVLEKNLSALTLNAQDAIHEYVLRQVRFEFLYKTVFENRVVKYFLKATPGLNDLVLLGKIWDLAQEAVRSKKGYDHIVVDMAASGHGFNMLKTPKTVMDMVQSGPLFLLAQKIDSIIRDEVLTGHILVTLAEELPVNESIEMMKNLNTVLGLHFHALLVNRILNFNLPETMPLGSSSDAQDMLTKAQKAAQFFRSRQAIQAVQLEKIKHLHPLLLPQVFAKPGLGEPLGARDQIDQLVLALQVQVSENENATQETQRA